MMKKTSAESSHLFHIKCFPFVDRLFHKEDAIQLRYNTFCFASVILFQPCFFLFPPHYAPVVCYVGVIVEHVSH